jgi:hypothetical protein
MSQSSPFGRVNVIALIPLIMRGQRADIVVPGLRQGTGVRNITSDAADVIVSRGGVWVLRGTHARPSAKLS